jgi:hypothetical protein
MAPVSVSATRRRRAALALATGVALVLAMRSGLDAPGLLMLAPAPLIAFSLLARRYPGQRLLLALARPTGDARARRWCGLVRAARRAPFAALPRGPLLMGFALAVRPPPACAAPA